MCLIMSHSESKSFLKKKSNDIEYKVFPFRRTFRSLSRIKKQQQKLSSFKAGKTKSNPFD